MSRIGMGQPVPREEDPYLLRGSGRYVDDVQPSHTLHGYVLRSPHAHAKILSIDTSEAEKAPGVHHVLTGNSEPVAALGVQRPVMPRKRRDGSPQFICSQLTLAKDTVRYVGDYVAWVVADTVAQAKDAAELIEVEYEILPAMISMEEAVKPGAQAVWADCPDNQAFFYEAGDKDAVEAAFAKADHVVSHKLVINRITTNSMEPRGCLAEYDHHDDRYTLRVTSQGPHRLRAVLANQLFKVPETSIHVIADNVGGGFGMKGGCYPEYTLSMVSAKLLGQPVKWISERSEGLISDEQARDNITEAELALDKDGKFLAMRARTLGNCGAYNNSERNAGPMIGNVGGLAGTYTTPVLHVEVTGVLTNTMLTAHYRGAGRPEASYVIETMIDMAARKLKMDPAEIRRINTIPADKMPYKTGLTFTYDSGDFLKNLEDCLKNADYAGFAARREESAKRGKLRGIAVTNTIEATAGRMLETAEIRFTPSGTATLMMGTHDHGQGHATTFKQIMSERLGIDADLIRFSYGDTDQVMMGTGTFGSRSAVTGGSAVVKATDKIIEKGKKIAAHLLEAAEADIDFEDGTFTVAGTDKSIGMIDVAKAAFQPPRLSNEIEAGMYEVGTYDGPPTFPNGCHICEVEIDPDTGEVDIVRYVVVDDVGVVINPLLLKGQVQGGIAQGAGQALFEDIALDSDGQVLSGSFMDYCMPRADDFCDMEIASNVVPCTTNPLGVKGAGEAGTVGALAAIMNAINDAVAQTGAEYVQMPATPQKIWRAIQAARTSRAA